MHPVHPAPASSSPTSHSPLHRLAATAATAGEAPAILTALADACAAALGTRVDVRDVIGEAAPAAHGDDPAAHDDGPDRAVVAGDSLVVVAARPLSGAERASVAALAAVAGAGLARIAAERRAGTLARAARALNASLDPQEVLDALARVASEALAADMTGVHLGDAARGLVGTAGHGTSDDWLGVRLRSGEGAAGRAVAAGAPYWTDAYEPAHPELAGVRAALAIPMAWGGAVRGAVSVGWTTHRRVTAQDRATLEAVTELAAVACRNAESHQQVQEVARTDALTGLLNHGALQVRVREEIARAERDGGPLALVILDLDDFKRVNDAQGHPAGDALLRRVAALLRSVVRPYDQVARYGGDEFVLVLPGSDEAKARAVAERVRDGMTGELATGCSLGVARWQPGMDGGALLGQADRALLLAKRTGKNRVAVANAELERELALLQARDGSPAAVQALAAAIEERDSYTHEHSEGVVHLARGVAMLLGLASAQVERIAHAALLHDVGKLAVPHEILHKDGPLTAAEWEVMAEHPVAGERVLQRIPALSAIAPVVRHEHEHWDGTGYPDGLRGAGIPVGSRIILACDAYHAMLAGRPYRRARSQPEALQELRRGAGAQFDPEVVEALLDLLGEARPAVPDRALGAKLPRV